MGVEVAGPELQNVNGEATPKLNDKENGSEPIKFGSHGVDEQQPKVEVKNVSNANYPKDAVDEWPDTPRTRTFWFVKYRSYDDPNLKAKLDQTDKEIQKKSHQRSQILDDLKAERSEKAELLAELKSLGAENSQYWTFINEKRQEMKPLQDALGTLRGSGREKGVGICSTEEELNKLIRSLEYQMQHESLSLKEEKQLLREIKELEATRPKVVANTIMRAKIQDSLGQKEAIQDQVKLLGGDLDGVRKQKAALKEKMDHIGEQVKALENQIKALQDELENVTEKRDNAFETIRQLRKKRDEANACFYQNRTLLNNVRELAIKKDLKALEELAEAEAEKFMSHWNTSKAFRDDYQKRFLMSLDMRQLSRDGRIRNPDEKPLVMPEAPRPSEREVAPKIEPKLQKEDSKNTLKGENLPAKKSQKDSKNVNKEPIAAPEQGIEEDIFVVEKPKKDVQENEMDKAKLKEMRKEEEKEKQRQALERKKKLQEKAAAKAALRAQKEAEKKQKEREKKLKKKQATSAPPTIDDELSEKDSEVAAEPEKPDNKEEGFETPAPAKAKGKEKKENTLRYRKTTSRTKGTLPKAVLKKKSANYMIIWASAGAALVAVMLLAVVYIYLL